MMMDNDDDGEMTFFNLFLFIIIIICDAINDHLQLFDHHVTQ